VRVLCGEWHLLLLAVMMSGTQSARPVQKPLVTGNFPEAGNVPRVLEDVSTVGQLEVPLYCYL
jgi:hypothetical protein